jgi:hypothetical protein
VHGCEFTCDDCEDVQDELMGDEGGNARESSCGDEDDGSETALTATTA